MSNLANLLIRAMVHTRRGPKAALLMGYACYRYTRAHHGTVINDAGETISFGRWYSLKAAVACGWRYLWPSK